MTDQPVPDWDKFPCLDGVGKEEDTTTKGSGSFEATYTNWAKVLRYMRQYAKGWMVGYRTWVDDSGRERIAHPQDDGTAVVVVFWRAPEGSGFLNTEDYPQPILRNNKPVQLSQCSALMVTNALKRGWAASAGAYFGLFSELWSKDPLEDPYLNEELEKAPQPAPKGGTPKVNGNTPTKQQSAAKAQVDPLIPRRDKCQEQLKSFYQSDTAVGTLWQGDLKEHFPTQITADKPSINNLTTEEQIAWCETWIETYKKNAKA